MHTSFASSHGAIEVYSTCPPFNGASQATYRRAVSNAARWSEAYGYTGMLVYTDNSLLDPWLLAQVIVQETTTLCPLVAVQPVYMHPYSVAKMVASIGVLYGRSVALNLVAGGFTQDLSALGDVTPHDQRYARLLEYGHIISGLLAGGAPLTFDGAFYEVRRLRLAPPLPETLQPTMIVSGSSDAGVATARAIGAVAVKYPRPAADETPAPPAVRSGVRLGVIAREQEEAAWTAARERFPEDRKGQLTHQLAMKTSDSLWHHQLSQTAGSAARGPYWLLPFQNYKTFCPYLVGTYRQVGDELARYIAGGYTTFILDVPWTEEDVAHTHAAFERALPPVTT